MLHVPLKLATYQQILFYLIFNDELTSFVFLNNEKENDTYILQHGVLHHNLTPVLSYLK